MMLAHRHIRGSFLESGFRRTEDMRKRGGRGEGTGHGVWSRKEGRGRGDTRWGMGGSREKKGGDGRA